MSQRLNDIAYVFKHALSGRAEALTGLKRYAEAAADWDKAVEISPQRTEPRMARAACRVQAGQVKEGIAEAEELLAKNADANTSYNVACIFAIAAERRDEPDGPLLKEERAQRAITLLSQAVAKGYKNVAHMKQDKELDALRDRDDFKKLLAKLEATK
jgi:tetratricopeptide (TPR) repeat protein